MNIPSSSPLQADERFEPYIRAALGRKSEALVAMDVHALTAFADLFLICSGRSTRQVKAIGDYIIREMKRQGVRPLSVEGLDDGIWVLLDYDDVIIHIFFDETRRMYDLESLWADAPRYDTTHIAPPAGPDMDTYSFDDDEELTDD
ncbi:MAG: ribosome silencing factor [Deltaproteobacteria bacterium]|nr:MAG: ribosome silencing factor [Deltaproteobacteria bacterium]